MNTVSGGPVNFDTLATMVGDDPQRQRHWLGRFMERAEETREEILAARERGDVARMGELGHRLKSPARSVGAEAVAEACLALEAAGKEGDGARADEQSRRLEERLAELASYLKGL